MIPLWVVRCAIAMLGLLSSIWDGAARARAFARFLLIVSQYDAVGERCGSRRLADYFLELVGNGGTDSQRAKSGTLHSSHGSVPTDAAADQKKKR